MRTVAVVTVARSDYGIYVPILHKISASPTLRLHLIVSGMHLSPEFGLTANRIEEDGFEIGDKVEMLLSSDMPEGCAEHARRFLPPPDFGKPEVRHVLDLLSRRRRN